MIGNVFDETAPQGLKLLYTSSTAAEADMLRQVLEEVGFHPEHVPSANAAVFGMVGNNSVFVPLEEFEQAEAFLKEYLAAEPILKSKLPANVALASRTYPDR